MQKTETVLSAKDKLNKLTSKNKAIKTLIESFGLELKS